MKWFETTTKVRWSEVDMQGIVYYANYFVYFDLVREYIAQTVDLDYMDEGIHVLTRDCQATFYSSAKYGDELILRAALAHPKVAKYTFHYRVLRKEGKQLLVEGKSDHILLDRDTNQLRIDNSKHKDVFIKAGIFPEESENL